MLDSKIVELLNDMSLDEKMEMLKLIEQNDKSTNYKLAKEAFKTSEYYADY